MLKRIFISAILLIFAVPVIAQNLDSANYTLIAPSIDFSSGIVTSTNYSALANSSPIDDFTSTSANYKLKGGTSSFIEGFVPTVICFETSTTSGTTNCTGIPGGDGMRGVCSTPGCYDRAKIEIDSYGNTDSIKYAIQIATNSTFTTGVQYISGANRFPKSALTLSDFLYKCEWEGTTLSGYCASPNTTYQKYNILGLKPNTLYYLRVSALTEVNGDASFSQSEWGPAVTATTENTSITFDIDIAPDTSTPSTPPYILTTSSIMPDTINTSSNFIIFRATANALNGMEVLVSSENEELINIVSGDNIPSYSGDLTSVGNGYGLRNDSATNTQTNSGYLGSINVSSSPIDFTDTGAAEKVGGPLTTFTKLFDSNGLPLLSGVTGFKLKVKADFAQSSGIYSDTLTIIPYGIY